MIIGLFYQHFSNQFSNFYKAQKPIKLASTALLTLKAKKIIGVRCTISDDVFTKNIFTPTLREDTRNC